MGGLGIERRISTDLFSNKVFLFVFLQIFLFGNLEAQPPLSNAMRPVLIEQGNHRCILTLIAASEGKINPCETIGFLDGHPVTAGKVVDLYQSNCLVSGQGGFHVVVEDYANCFCVDKMREGPPITLTSQYEPSDVVCDLRNSVTYEKLPPQRFGWCAPSNATVQEVLETRVDNVDCKLNNYSATPPRPLDCSTGSCATKPEYEVSLRGNCNKGGLNAKPGAGCSSGWDFPNRCNSRSIDLDGALSRCELGLIGPSIFYSEVCAPILGDSEPVGEFCNVNLNNFGITGEGSICQLAEQVAEERRRKGQVSVYNQLCEWERDASQNSQCDEVKNQWEQTFSNIWNLCTAPDPMWYPKISRSTNSSRCNIGSAIDRLNNLNSKTPKNQLKPGELPIFGGTYVKNNKYCKFFKDPISGGMVESCR